MVVISKWSTESGSHDDGRITVLPVRHTVVLYRSTVVVTTSLLLLRTEYVRQHVRVIETSFGGSASLEGCIRWAERMHPSGVMDASVGRMHQAPCGMHTATRFTRRMHTTVGRIARGHTIHMTSGLPLAYIPLTSRLHRLIARSGQGITFSLKDPFLALIK